MLDRVHARGLELIDLQPIAVMHLTVASVL